MNIEVTTFIHEKARVRLTAHLVTDCIRGLGWMECQHLQPGDTAMSGPDYRHRQSAQDFKLEITTLMWLCCLYHI